MTRDLGRRVRRTRQPADDQPSSWKDALDRFSWARTMFMRHEKLRLPCSWQPSTLETKTSTRTDLAQDPQPADIQTPKPSKLVASVDTLIEQVENAIKKEQDTDESDQVCRATFVIACFFTLSAAQRRQKTARISSFYNMPLPLG